MNNEFANSKLDHEPKAQREYDNTQVITEFNQDIAHLQTAIERFKQKKLNQQTLIEIIIKILDEPELNERLSSLSEQELIFFCKQTINNLTYQRNQTLKSLNVLDQQAQAYPEADHVIEQVNQQSTEDIAFQGVWFEILATTGSKFTANLAHNIKKCQLVLEKDESKLPEIRQATSECVVTIHDYQFNLPTLLGSAFTQAYAQLTRPGHDQESFAQAKAKFKELLSGTQMTVALICLSLIEQNLVVVDINNVEASFINLTRNLADYADIDYFHSLMNRVQAITIQSTLSHQPSSTLSAQQETHSCMARLLYQEVAAGELDHHYARELLIDLQEADSSRITAAYLNSFANLLSLQRERATTEQESEVNYMRYVMLFVIFTLLMQLISKFDKTDFNFTQILDQAGEIAEILTSLPEQFSSDSLSFSSLPEDDSLSKPETVTAKPLSSSQQQNLYEANLRAVEKLIQTPGTPHHAPLEGKHKTDQANLNREAYSLSVEAHRAAELTIYGKLQNWSQLPSAMHLSNQTLDRSNMSLINSQPKDSNGNLLPTITYEQLATTQNLLIAKRQSIPFNYWFMVPHPPDMEITTATLFVQQNGDIVATMPIEIQYNQGSQFAKIQLTEDQTWIGEQTNLNFTLAYQYSETSKPTYEFSQPNTAEMNFDRNIFPQELNHLINSLNQDNSMSEKEKLQSLQSWFHNFGLYSFHPKNNYDNIISEAISQGVLSNDQRFEAFLQLFYQGKHAPFLSQIDLSYKNEIQAGAGACGTRNTAALLAFSQLELNDWQLQLRSAFLVNDSVITSNQAHLNIIATNSNNEVLDLDVTAAPYTDELTQRAISESTVNDTENQSAEEQLIKDRLIEMHTNNHMFPTQWSTDLSTKDFQVVFKQIPNTDSSYVTQDNALTASKIPWDLELNPTLKSNLFKLSLFPLQIGGQDFISISGVKFNPDVKNLYLDPRDYTYQRTYVITPTHPTNVIPLLARYNLDKINVDSIKVTFIDDTGAERQLPFRIESFSSNSAQPVLVIDLDPDILLGRRLEINFEYTIENSIIVDPAETKPAFEALPKLLELGFSKQEAAGLILQHQIQAFAYTTQDLSNIPTETFAYFKSQGITIPSELELLLPAFFKLNSIPSNDTQLLKDMIETISEINSEIPNFLNLVYQYNKNLFNFRGPSTEQMDEIKNKIINGQHVPVYQYLELFKEESARVNHFKTLVQSYLRDYLIPTHFPVEHNSTKSVIGNKDSQRLTPETTSFQFCEWIDARSPQQIVKCILDAPSINSVMAYLRDYYILQALQPMNHKRPPSITISQDSEDFLLSFHAAQILAIQYPQIYPQYHSLPKQLYTLPQDYYYSSQYCKAEIDSNALSLEERMSLGEKEKRETVAWMRKKTLEELFKLNPHVLARFLPIMLATAALGWSAARALALKNKYTDHPTLGRAIANKLDRNHIPLSVLTQQAAQKLGIQPQDLPPFDHEIIWQAQPGPQYNWKILAASRMIATQARIKGTPRTFLPSWLRRTNEDLINPWNSREIPPSYITHIHTASINLAHFATAMCPLEANQAEHTLKQALRFGIGQKNFADNLIIEQNPDQWKQTLTNIVQDQLIEQKIEYLMYPNLSQAIDFIYQVWVAIMKDYKTYQGI